jgi:hypothetical protein
VLSMVLRSFSLAACSSLSDLQERWSFAAV